jgi:hypothetical protein
MEFSMEEVMNKIADALRNLPPELRGTFIVLIEAREDGKTVTVHPAKAFLESIRNL